METASFIVIGFYLLLLLYAIILHEVAHGVVALWLGDRTALYAGRLTLRPQSHIEPFGSIVLPVILLLATNFRFTFGWARPVPYDPSRLRGGAWGPVLVALAGPATNILLATVAAAVAALTPLTADRKMAVLGGVMDARWADLGPLLAGSLPAIVFLLCAIAIFWNVLLAVFNLLPIPPLDGSKLLYALIDVPYGVRAFLEQWGFVVLFAVVFFFPGPLNALLTAAWSLFFGIALI